jgi:ubiquinone/menaquinone biosynthesis C-methylase UbiE
MAFAGQGFAWHLYRYGVASGWASLAQVTDASFAAGLLFHPIGYWESAELPLLVREFRPAPGERILDVGSPKLLALYLAEKCGARVEAADERADRIVKFARLGHLRKVPDERLRLEVAAGERLPYEDNSFAKAYCMGRIDPQNAGAGSRLLREIRRVLIAGGRCCVSVPFALGGSPDMSDFSEESIRSSLVRETGFVVDKIICVAESFHSRGRRGLEEYLHPLLGAIFPALSGIFHVERPLTPVPLPRPRRALVLLRKPCPGDREVAA